MAQKFKRGDIFYVDFGEPVGHVQGGVRPALVIQNDKGNYYSPTLLVAPLTTQEKSDLPTHMNLDMSCGISKPSTVLFEQSKVVDKQQVKGYIGHVNLNKYAETKILIAFGCLDFLGGEFKKILYV